jgi:hypothetical protein
MAQFGLLEGRGGDDAGCHGNDDDGVKAVV